MGSEMCIRDSQWTIQLGISDGTDVAIWQKDPGRQPTGTVMVQWTAPNQMDSVYVGDNVINDGEWGYNNMQQLVGTWTHKFNDKIYTTTEAWYMWEHDAISHPTNESKVVVVSAQPSGLHIQKQHAARITESTNDVRFQGLAGFARLAWCPSDGRLALTDRDI